ncbi:MAG: hypothetical protein ACTSR8_12625 [Promethearchaeota archaeon]
MSEFKDGMPIKEIIINKIKEGKIDESVEIIGEYLNTVSWDQYIDRLESIIETVSALHGGRTVIRFLIENSIIDIPSLLESLSKKDPILRYSFLYLLKSMCENEYDLFLPYSEELLNSDDPNVREADLQLLLFIAGGDVKIEDQNLIKKIAMKLKDDKNFVVEKAVQTLKALGKKNPNLINQILTKFLKESMDNEAIKESVADILKFLVSVEIKEDISESSKKEKELKPIKTKELIEKPLGDLEEEDIEKVQAIIEDKEKELKVKELELKEKALKLKEELLEKESKLTELSQVEIELKEKEIADAEERIKEEEARRVEEKLKSIEKKEKEN